MDMSQNPWHKHAPNNAEIWAIRLHLVNLFIMAQIKKIRIWTYVRWNCNPLPDFGNSTTDFQASVTSSRESLNLDIVQSENKNKDKNWGSMYAPLLHEAWTLKIHQPL